MNRQQISTRPPACSTLSLHTLSGVYTQTLRSSLKLFTCLDYFSSNRKAFYIHNSLFLFPSPTPILFLIITFKHSQIGVIESNMSSENSSAAVDQGNETPTENRSCPSKTKKKVPKRIHKAEREKLKREQLNDLFLDLAGALENNQPNTGKATLLSEATRLLKDLLGQLEFLKKEHDTLLSESQYVTVENNELKEENSALETQIGKLQVELETKVRQSQPDLNVPPSEFQQELNPHFQGEFLPVMDGAVQPQVFVVPIHPDHQSCQVASPHVSKPRARYPTPADSWPSKLLGEQLHCQEGNSA